MPQTALPVRTLIDNTYPLPTTSQRKTALGDIRDYLEWLFGAGGSRQTARDTLEVGMGSGRNKFTNGGCMVAQRALVSAIALSTAAKVGSVDDIAVWASGGVVSAGTITQTTASVAGQSGYACRAAGVTLTGSGVMSFRKRVESREAVKIKNQTGVFSVQVWHDVGSSINYTIIVRKPTAADNYGSVTTIYTSSAIGVPNNTGTRISIPATALGDVSNGIEVEVQAACGAITAKNFDTTEWQIEQGTLPSLFEQRRYDDELRACRRFLPGFQFVTGVNEDFCWGACNTTSGGSMTCTFEVEARTPPTGIIANATWSMTTATVNNAVNSIAYSSAAKKSARLTLNTVSATFTIKDYAVAYANSAGVLLFTGAELAA